MIRKPALGTFGLKFNPFPPAAAGIALGQANWIPDAWASEITSQIGQLSYTEGYKALAIVGGYGTGKTFLLQWIMENQYSDLGIKAYFIGNPGVTFYNIADQLFRQVGRYEFSKGLWELLNTDIPTRELQGDFLKREFSVWLDRLASGTKRNEGTRDIQEAILKQGITEDEEIAFRFGRMMVDTKDRPFYRFQDFIPRSATTLVAENREGEYFNTVIRILQRMHGATGIAFMVDEFEDAALGKRLSGKQRAEYHATLRNLLDTARDEDFWLTLSSTPLGFEQTRNLEPALIQRFGSQFRIPPLTDDEAYELAYHRLVYAEVNGRPGGLWPFKDDVLLGMAEANRSWPRGLIKILSQSLAVALRDGIDPPIPNALVQKVEAELQTHRIIQNG